MGWVTYGEWKCIFASVKTDVSNIKFMRTYEGKEMDDFCLDSLYSGYKYDKRLMTLFRREDCIAEINGVDYNYVAQSEKQETAFQKTGIANAYCILSFLKRKKTFAQGDIIAVFCDDLDDVNSPIPLNLSRWEKFLDGSSLLNFKNSENEAIKIFPALIQKEILKRQEKDREKKLIDQADKQEATRKAETQKIETIEREAREKTRIMDELRASELRIKEDRERVQYELQAERERDEFQTNSTRERARIQTRLMEEEKELTAELLAMREKIARIDGETNSKTLAGLFDMLKPTESRKSRH